MPRNRLADLQQAQQKANTYTFDFLKTNVIPLPQTLTDDEYKAVMDAIVRAIGTAYAMGYGAGIDAK